MSWLLEADTPYVLFKIAIVPDTLIVPSPPPRAKRTLYVRSHCWYKSWSSFPYTFIVIVSG